MSLLDKILGREPESAMPEVSTTSVALYSATSSRGWKVTAAAINGRTMIVCSHEHAIVCGDLTTIHTLPTHLKDAALACVLQMAHACAPLPIPTGNG